MIFEEILNEQIPKPEMAKIRNKINNVLNWTIKDYKYTDIFTRKAKALLQRKPNDTLYTYYIVLKRGNYPVWREKKEVLKRYNIKKIIQKHKYTFFFAKEREDIEAYIRFLKMDIKYHDISMEGLKVFPYEFRYRLKPKDEEDWRRLHLSIEPDPDLVKGWIKLEAYIVKHYGYNKAVRYINFVRWKLFAATKYAFWDRKLVNNTDGYIAKRLESKYNSEYDRFERKKNPDPVESLYWHRAHKIAERNAKFVLNYCQRKIKEERRTPPIVLLTLDEYKKSGFNIRKAFKRVRKKNIN